MKHLFVDVERRNYEVVCNSYFVVGRKLWTEVKGTEITLHFLPFPIKWIAVLSSMRRYYLRHTSNCEWKIMESPSHLRIMLTIFHETYWRERLWRGVRFCCLWSKNNVWGAGYQHSTTNHNRPTFYKKHCKFVFIFWFIWRHVTYICYLAPQPRIELDTSRIWNSSATKYLIISYEVFVDL